MPAALIFHISGIGVAEYDKVNELLGIDQKNNSGNWPPGLLSHAAGVADDRSFYVIEVWESRDAQARWMQTLGPAMQKGGVTAAPTMTWIDLASYNLPQGAPAR